MIFYKFEVFAHDWVGVFVNMSDEGEYWQYITNETAALAKFHEAHRHDIWVGYNTRHYEQYILKAILCGDNPWDVHCHISSGGPGYKFGAHLSKIPLNNYDIMQREDRGLKVLMAHMGLDIWPLAAPRDGERLTRSELQAARDHCAYDIQAIMQIFLTRVDDFMAHREIVRLASEPMNLALFGKTKPQLAAVLLDAKGSHRATTDGLPHRATTDEFDIDTPPPLRVEKYRTVVDWYVDSQNRVYGKQLHIDIAGVAHTFGWGGVHGARPKYSGEGLFIAMDVVGYYPALMVKYGLLSRQAASPEKFGQVYSRRTNYKISGDPLQLPLKMLLNSTYGAMKDAKNPLYDPRQANRVCCYAQLLLLDLIEHLEPHCQIIQTNTDGVLVRLADGSAYDKIDDVCFEWEQRTGMRLEFEEYARVLQKDVNNYVAIRADGSTTDGLPHRSTTDGLPHRSTTARGVYKLPGPLDYDLPIVNKAIIAYITQGVPIADTINACDNLWEFQQIVRTNKEYPTLCHGKQRLRETVCRVFASTDWRDPKMMRLKDEYFWQVVQNTPNDCFIVNEDVRPMKIPAKLSKRYYVDLATKRLNELGVDI